jgi:hypothetical protein
MNPAFSRTSREIMLQQPSNCMRPESIQRGNVNFNSRFGTRRTAKIRIIQQLRRAIESRYHRPERFAPLIS